MLMEEIKVVINSSTVSEQDRAILDFVINRSKHTGAQVGIVWDKFVYDYLFESNIVNIDLEDVFGCDLFQTEDYMDIV